MPFTLLFSFFYLTAQTEYPTRKKFSFNATHPSYIQDWNPVNDPDNHFNISRIPLKNRFIFTASQTDPNLSNEKDYLLWMIAPNETRGSDKAFFTVINGMEYRDKYCLWTSGGGLFELPPAGHIDACHKQGVKAFGNITFADGASYNDPKWLGMFAKDSQGNFIHARKIVEIAKYYGIDGLSLNWEVRSMANSLAVTYADGQEFLKQVRKQAIDIGLPDFEIAFYYVWFDNGNRSFYIKSIVDEAENKKANEVLRQRVEKELKARIDKAQKKELNERIKRRFNSNRISGTEGFFGSANNIVSTAPFINYEWAALDIEKTVDHVKSIGRDPYDVYFGLTFYGDKKKDFGALKYNPVSIGAWGEALKKTLPDYPETNSFLKEIAISKKVELYLNGPNNDPSNPGILTPESTGYSLGDWGVCAFKPAKTTIQNIPWHTDFSTGNGKGYYNKGKQIHSNEWHDASLQSEMPTWKWWWQKGGNGLTCKVDYYRAYTGATSVNVKGNIPDGDNVLRLFKTKLTLKNTSKAIVTYRVNDDTNIVPSNLDLALSFEDGSNISKFTSIAIGNTTKKGWNTAILDLSAYAGKTIAVIGVNINGTNASYDLNIGGLTITNEETRVPTTPANLKNSQVSIQNNLINVRIEWELPNNPRYNETVYVDHFEIYQVNGLTNEKSLIGKSVARGFIAKNIPLLYSNTNLEFEVVSVAADHITKSKHISIKPTIK